MGKAIGGHHRVDREMKIIPIFQFITSTTTTITTTAIAIIEDSRGGGGVIIGECIPAAEKACWNIPVLLWAPREGGNRYRSMSLLLILLRRRMQRLRMMRTIRIPTMSSMTTTVAVAEATV
jgi:hypothetical protein